MTNQIWLPASSPLFTYSPTSPWLGVLDPALSQPNNTYKAISGSGGFVLPNIYVSRFTPIWDGSSFTVTLTPSSGEAIPWNSGQTCTLEGQGRTQNTYQVDVQCSTSDCSSDPFKFHGAWIEPDFGPPGSQVESATLDDASPYITYSGFASVLSGSSSMTPDATDTNSTLSSTSTAGASASLSIQGTSILVYGVTAPSLGTYAISLDGSPPMTLEANDNVITHANILFFATHLDPSRPHQVVLTCQGGGLVLDAWVVHGPQGQVGFGGSPVVNGPVGTGSPVGPGQPTASASGAAGAAASGGSTNAGTIVGAILGTLAGIALLIYLFRKIERVKADKERKLNAWDAANNLQEMRNQAVHVTTAANELYVYPGLKAHSQLKK